MKLIIAGSRTVPRSAYPLIEKSIRKPKVITEIVCGDARGADRLGEQWASSHNIPVAHFPAHWDRFGRLAGRIRNAQMAAYADCLLAIWDGESPGTRHMISEMRKRNKPVKVVACGGPK